MQISDSINQQVNFATNWYSPTKGSPDYFNSCSANTQIITPGNYMGWQEPYIGNAYIGLQVYHAVNPGTEYIQTQLNSALIAGNEYQIRFYLSFAEKSDFSFSVLGASLSNVAVSRADSLSITANPQLRTAINLYYTDTANWVKVEGRFFAAGGEKFLTIGNFNTNANSLTMPVNWTNSGYNNAYYYIDEVSILEIKDSVEFRQIPNVISPNNDNLNDIFLLNFKYENVQVLNRWGEIIYSENYGAIPWDGRNSDGEEVPEGIYFYIIKTEKDLLRGTISLFR